MNKIAAYLQVVRDDFCLFETCFRLAEEGLTDFFFVIPKYHWSGTEADRTGEVYAVIDRLKHSFSAARFEAITYDQMPTGQRLVDRETSVRNNALLKIRQKGYDHVLVVDGDELWRRGFLGKVVNVINERQPPAISCDMIPAIGVPSYPVEDATDRATIYIGQGVFFQNCRGSNQPAIHMDERGIIHFTATRKTREEVAAKYRESGHYDDKDYHFEHWIENVLPEIRPGSRNVHPYRNGVVWPLVRPWRVDERAEMSESLIPFLGV
jgi:hypothetical protein